MGFLKDLRTISKQSRELDRNRDVGAEMARASAALAQANQIMVDQANAGVLARGAPAAMFQVLAARDTGAVVNMQPMLEIDLLVQHDGGLTYPATVRQVVPAAGLGRVVPGATLRGKADPAERRAPTPLGYSTGKWDGESLVVTTTDISWPYFQLYGLEGVPQSPETTLVERFTASADASELLYDIAATDPHTFTATVTAQSYRTFRWVPGFEFLPQDCVLE